MMEFMSLMALEIGAERREEVFRSSMHAARGHPAHISEPTEAAIEPAEREIRLGTGDCWHGAVRKTGWQGNVG